MSVAFLGSVAPSPALLSVASTFRSSYIICSILCYSILLLQSLYQPLSYLYIECNSVLPCATLCYTVLPCTSLRFLSYPLLKCAIRYREVLLVANFYQPTILCASEYKNKCYPVLTCTTLWFTVLPCTNLCYPVLHVQLCNSVLSSSTLCQSVKCYPGPILCNPVLAFALLCYHELLLN